MNRARYASRRDGQKRCTGGVAQRRRQQTVTLRQGNTGGSSPPATTIRLVANRRIDDRRFDPPVRPVPLDRRRTVEAGMTPGHETTGFRSVSQPGPAGRPESIGQAGGAKPPGTTRPAERVPSACRPGTHTMPCRRGHGRHGMVENRRAETMNAPSGRRRPDGLHNRRRRFDSSMARPSDRTMACPSSRSGPMWRVRGGRRRTAGGFRHSPR